MNDFGIHSTATLRADLRMSGLRLPNHPDAIRWLEAYYSHHLYQEQGPLPDSGGTCPPILQPSFWGAAAAAGGCRGGGSGQYFPGGLLPPSKAIPGAKKNLILVPVGDRWDPYKKTKCVSGQLHRHFCVLGGV